MDVKRLDSPQDLEAAFVVLKELRTELEWNEFLEIYANARQRDDYQLVGVLEQTECVAVMGYRVLFDFVHGKHLYVDDLVTYPSCRSRGLGSKLLQFAETEAAKLGCRGLRLCTGESNQGGRKFYEREGWRMRSVAYKKPVASPPSA